MELKINKEILRKLKVAGFYPDNMISSYFALMALHLGEAETLDIWDDYNTSRRAVVIYYDLVDKGLWEEDPASLIHFKETEKGQILAEELISLAFQTPKTENDVEEWIDNWLDLFPKGVKSGGKLLRSDRKSCLAKMKSFVKAYKYDKDTILGATLAYLSEREREGFTYTRCAVYFIGKKGEGSDLASWCDKIKEEPDQVLFDATSDLI